ncbi:MAG: phosphatase PAP2 family protein [Gemmatimonadaceae bacterium]
MPERMANGALLARLDARDRALFTRLSVFETASRNARVFWTTITHMGGVVSSISLATFPFVTGGALVPEARRALATLVISHVIVQFVKRTVGRPRPARVLGDVAIVVEPDRFSFPSGHAAAAMSVAIVYAIAFPAFASILIPLAMLVGMSRVCLGVHYPGDVLMGQIIAVLTAIPVVLS